MLEIGEAVPESAYQALIAKRSTIDAEFESTLIWRKTPKRFQISATRNDLDPNQSSQWAEQHTWMLAQLRRFKTVFAERIRSLDFDVNERNDAVPDLPAER